MAVTPMALHVDAVRAATVDRQNAMAVPGLTAAAAKAADIAFHQAAVTSAMVNSISPVASLTALRELGAAAPALRTHRGKSPAWSVPSHRRIGGAYVCGGGYGS
jgi:hypothetical protein